MQHLTERNVSQIGNGSSQIDIDIRKKNACREVFIIVILP